MPTRAGEFEVQRVQERREQARLRGPAAPVPALGEPLDRTPVTAVGVAPPARGGLVGRDAGTALDSWHEMFGGRRNQRSEPSATPQAAIVLSFDGERESGGAVHLSIVTESLPERQCPRGPRCRASVVVPFAQGSQALAEVAPGHPVAEITFIRQTFAFSAPYHLARVGFRGDTTFEASERAFGNWTVSRAVSPVHHVVVQVRFHQGGSCILATPSSRPDMHCWTGWPLHASSAPIGSR
ncbi:hypothetical protein RHRU231_710126 [Rhodococcus ruber]|uniref:Uncharacterized protein n=1 Tax=Rhodococcus ruber TaxID=1830 RepID=A0A098BPD2_9NOCA|nr:hypothetical protein RHRU231_710126 [Rhodococcus ruber]